MTHNDGSRKPSVLFRKGVNPGDEGAEYLAIEDAGFLLSYSRNDASLFLRTVVGRYSVMPYYKELEEDLQYNGAKLIHNYRDHMYIANGTYIEDLVNLTPKTWDRYQDIPPSFNGPFFVKGKTNSRKDQPWTKACYAKDRVDLLKVISFLENDSFISSQGLLIREYVPLVTYLEGVTGQPITNEWRVFCYGKTILAGGYYWASYDDETRDLRPQPLPEEAKACVKAALKAMSGRNMFCVVDVAEKASGGWMVVEVNDGQMSGLSNVDPNEMYRNLYEALKESKP